MVDADLTFDIEPEKPEREVLAEACSAQINEILSRTQISFPPGETDIAEESLPVIEDITTVLEACPASRFEIGGHTDSQGRETTNLGISQARADAVMAALLKRGLTNIFFTAQGYGETVPVADNETEEGRAANRRIEFRMITKDEEAVSAVDPDEEANTAALETEPEAEAEEVSDTNEVTDEPSVQEEVSDAPKGISASEEGAEQLRPRIRDLE